MKIMETIIETREIHHAKPANIINNLQKALCDITGEEISTLRSLLFDLIENENLSHLSTGQRAFWQIGLHAWLRYNLA